MATKTKGISKREQVELYWASEAGQAEKELIDQEMIKLGERTQEIRKFIREEFNELTRTMGFAAWQAVNVSSNTIKIQYVDPNGDIPSFNYGFEITFDIWENTNEYDMKMLSNPRVSYNSLKYDQLSIDMLILFAAIIKYSKSNIEFDNTVVKYINECRFISNDFYELKERKENPKM